jgi:hypothetical protein
MDDNNPIDTLAQRCTLSARLLLLKFQNHPRFPDVVDRLTATVGLLLESDVEQAFREVMVQHPRKK